MDEEIAGEHRHLDPVPLLPPAGPHVDLRIEDAEAAGGQLVLDELLAVAACPHDVPARRRDGGREAGRRGPSGFFEHHSAAWQGFAPFGAHPSGGCDRMCAALPIAAPSSDGPATTTARSSGRPARR